MSRYGSWKSSYLSSSVRTSSPRSDLNVEISQIKSTWCRFVPSSISKSGISPWRKDLRRLSSVIRWNKLGRKYAGYPRLWRAWMMNYWCSSIASKTTPWIKTSPRLLPWMMHLTVPTISQACIPFKWWEASWTHSHSAPSFSLQIVEKSPISSKIGSTFQLRNLCWSCFQGTSNLTWRMLLKQRCRCESGNFSVRSTVRALPLKAATTVSLTSSGRKHMSTRKIPIKSPMRNQRRRKMGRSRRNKLSRKIPKGRIRASWRRIGTSS